MERLTLNISGMSCGHCVGRVTQALAGVDGVRAEDVRIGSATVSYDAGKTSVAQIVEALDSAGYSVQPGDE